ncbi:MAG: beta-ketoacyl-[acyl-carrier-protein] synthase II [Armatimonadetes bacterium]|nr:beta-ketoacyl-[acyl-carrier-protein] synthase II [Armatimonadota bacterium]
MRRAVITGIGPVTPIGVGKEAFWTGLRSGESAVRRISAFDPAPFRTQIAAEVRDFDPSDYLDSKQLRRLNRHAQFAVTAARLAVQDSSLDMANESRNRIGVCMGSAFGGRDFAEEVFCCSGSSGIAMDQGITGPVSSNSNGCASGTIALGEALVAIRWGQTDIVLAGGAEAPISPACIEAFSRIRMMSCRNDEPARACRPFDAGRDGFVIGEGAAVLVVEEFHHALNRGAHVYCEIVGYGLTNDAHHTPDGAQAARAMLLAMSDAGLWAEDIDYINAHGVSTLSNDRIETTAIKSVFGDHALQLAISGTKGHHAHSLGASGAIEAAACALAMERSYIPPTLNLDNPDDECDLDYTPKCGRSREVRTAISNSFGFGGINACLVMSKTQL